MLCLTLLLGMQESAQQGEPATPTHNQFPSLASQRSMGGDVDFPTDDPVWQEKQLRVLNIERQKALVSDTNKLLKLAHDLDAEVSGTTSDSLTPDQIRTLAEIEKLAHSVKEKMSISLQRPSFQQQNPAFPQRDPVIPTMTP
jgi:hypothetical protein